MFSTFFHRAVLTAISLLFGCTGEIITEKSGNLNLGVPGVMCVGGIAGFTGAFMYEFFWGGAQNPNAFLAIIIPLLFCLIGSLIMGLIYSFLTTTLRANQNVTGLALTIFGAGLSDFMGSYLVKQTNSGGSFVSINLSSKYYMATLPFTSKLGWFGEMFLSYGFLAYVSIIIAVLAALFLMKTRTGLNLRAVGENPATADAAGINVTKYKYVATCVGCMIAGLGGLFYVMNKASGVWSSDNLEPLGWLAIALVIFTVWKPNFAIPGAIIFGGLSILTYHLSTSNVISLSLEAKPLMEMLPYVVTVIVLVFNSLRKRRETQPPEALGLPYFREDR